MGTTFGQNMRKQADFCIATTAKFAIVAPLKLGAEK